jgi:hypothetical protein
MISNVKFNELEKRFDLLVEKVTVLEEKVRVLTDTQGGEIPPGMTPVATLAAEYGISTKKAEELAKNTGVMLVKLKSGGFVAPDEKFREAADWCSAAPSANTVRRTGFIRCSVSSR